MPKPLHLPVGSVRALLLLGISAAGVLLLRRDHEAPAWLLAALVVSACAYFASRRGGVVVTSGIPPPRAPLGLPGGTVRFLFLAVVGYGAWLWGRDHDLRPQDQPLALVVAAFWIGVMVRFFMGQIRRPDDASTLAFDHLQALAALICAGGLVWISAEPASAVDVSTWTAPSLAAACTYYAGAR